MSPLFDSGEHNHGMPRALAVADLVDGWPGAKKFEAETTLYGRYFNERNQIPGRGALSDILG